MTLLDFALYEGQVPAGYASVTRKGRVRGLKRYGGGRVDDRLGALVRAGRLNASFDDIDLFQRISNVETGGQVQALNTWDSAVVSVGFLQLTLRYGELQRWIAAAPAAFARYGIRLDPSRRYAFPKSRTGVPAIVGAADPEELRWGHWADRFYRAGLDDEIIVAEVAVGLERNARHLERLRSRLASKRGGFELFMTHYRASPYVRAVFQEAWNNRPAYALTGTVAAVTEALRRGTVTTDQMTGLLVGAIRRAFDAREPGKAERIFKETLTGARRGILDGSGPSGTPAAPAPSSPAQPPAAGRPRSSSQWNAVRATPGSIVPVGGIRVHLLIAPQLAGMKAAAAADGVILEGWGYRSSESQVALRRRHCGSSQYDIYEKPSRECRPPTARPGKSRHEQGLAVDFRLDRGGRMLAWLRANAGRFGFVNLPSEPWHWSVDGR